MVEVPVVLGLARLGSFTRYGLVGMVAVGAQCLTHPIVWHMASLLAPDEYAMCLLALEAAAVVVEGLWYQLCLRPGWTKAMLWSLVANLASLVAGYLMQLLTK